MKDYGTKHPKHFPLFVKDPGEERQKEFTTFLNSDGHTPKEEQVINWADELEAELALLHGHGVRDMQGQERAGMSRTLRPFSDWRSVVGGCKHNNTLTQSVTFI
jgi:hypothetical protein